MIQAAKEPERDEGACQGDRKDARERPRASLSGAAVDGVGHHHDADDGQVVDVDAHGEREHGRPGQGLAGPVALVRLAHREQHGRQDHPVGGQRRVRVEALDRKGAEGEERRRDDRVHLTPREPVDAAGPQGRVEHEAREAPDAKELERLGQKGAQHLEDEVEEGDGIYVDDRRQAGVGNGVHESRRKVPRRRAVEAPAVVGLREVPRRVANPVHIGSVENLNAIDVDEGDGSKESGDGCDGQVGMPLCAGDRSHWLCLSRSCVPWSRRTAGIATVIFQVLPFYDGRGAHAPGWAEHVQQLIN